MHTNRDKSIAIRQLIVNLGDVDKTHQQTNIPKSTLFRWKNQLKSYEDIVFWEYDTKTKVVRDNYEYIRDGMLTQIRQLLEHMNQYGPEYALDYANAVARLTDRIAKVEAMLQISGQFTIMVELSKLEETDSRQQRLADPDDTEP